MKRPKQGDRRIGDNVVITKTLCLCGAEVTRARAAHSTACLHPFPVCAGFDDRGRP